MNAFERREQIIDRMKVRKFGTAQSLAAEFGVSPKTIYRDIAELSVNGYPIASDMGRGGGIQWLGSKRQFPFTENEVAALHSAIVSASPENKIVLESLLRENTKPEVKIGRNDLFKLLTGAKSQHMLARELGISKSYFSRLLSGERKPSAGLARKITDMLNADIGISDINKKIKEERFYNV